MAAYIQKFLLSLWEAWSHAGRHGAGDSVYGSASESVDRRKRDTGTGFSILKSQLPTPPPP